MKSGWELDNKNESGETPLHIASRNGFLDIVAYLTKKGANINQ